MGCLQFNFTLLIYIVVLSPNSVVASNDSDDAAEGGVESTAKRTEIKIVICGNGCIFVRFGDIILKRVMRISRV